jgi:hypothetical protein
MVNRINQNESKEYLKSIHSEEPTQEEIERYQSYMNSD